MIIPYSTDAPIYHLPIATGAVIAANVLLFGFVFSLDKESFEFANSWLAINYGGFNPLCWITLHYMHADIMHLLMNMFALWVFGLIVEGKVGWTKFLLYYHGIGIIFGFTVQMLTLVYGEGRGLGASAAVYGLMGMVLIWAPINQIHCYWFSRFGGLFEVPVYLFVGAYLILQVVYITLDASTSTQVLKAVTGEVAHLMGAVLGAGLAIYLLQKGLVDCENWDIFSVAQGKHTARPEEKSAEEFLKSEEGQAKLQNARETTIDQIRQYVAAGAAQLAWGAYKRGLNQFPGFQLPEHELLSLIGTLRKAGMWDETIVVMVAFLRTYPQRDAAVRLALAQIMLEKKQRGAQALKVLQKVDPRRLDPRQVPTYEKFVSQAQSMSNDDPYEVAAEDW